MKPSSLHSILPAASYSGFPMDSLKTSYSGSYSSGGYGSSGYSSGGYSSGGYGSSSGGFSGGSNYSVQSKKNVVIKMIETKDGRVVSESSEVIED